MRNYFEDILRINQIPEEKSEPENLGSFDRWSTDQQIAASHLSRAELLDKICDAMNALDMGTALNLLEVLHQQEPDPFQKLRSH